jgi:GDP-mannose pyrophosphatase NudK
MINKVKILQTDILSDEDYLLKKITYEYYKPDGSRHEQKREVYDRGNAAAILLYNKEKKTVILTKQFRLPAFINGTNPGILMEVCAGMLDNENPEDGIIRETEEETGYKISDVQKIFEAYMSPGGLTELLYFFIAEYNESMKVNEGGGAKGEEENIDVMELNIEQAMQMIRSGEIKDGKTIMLLQHTRLYNIL